MFLGCHSPAPGAALSPPIVAVFGRTCSRCDGPGVERTGPKPSPVFSPSPRLSRGEAPHKGGTTPSFLTSQLPASSSQRARSDRCVHQPARGAAGATLPLLCELSTARGASKCAKRTEESACGCTRLMPAAAGLIIRIPFMVTTAADAPDCFCLRSWHPTLIALGRMNAL